MKRAPDFPLAPIALLHDDFPDLAPEDAGLFAASLRYDALESLVTSRFVYFNPAPMSVDPIPTSAFVASRSLKRIALCFDFIPLEMPEQFLARVTERIRYLSQLAHLVNYDFYFSISNATDRKVRNLCAAHDFNTQVIGCPVIPRIESAGANQRSLDHRNMFLVVGDPSSHKDVATAVRGHARFIATTGHRIPLVVTGRIPQLQIDTFEREYEMLCGRPQLLHCKGVVEDSVLERLYNSSIAVLVPSRAEGFSMPVIEAMCCGAVVVASDIDAHRSLVPQSSMLFPPGDDVALCRILTEIVPQLDVRQRIVQENDSVWIKFTAEQVALRFWERMHQVTAFQLGLS